MASTRTKTTFRIVVAVLLIVAFFYIFGNTSAAVREIRQNKQTVTQGFSRIVYRAQRSVRWYSESAATRRILLQVLRKGKKKN